MSAKWPWSELDLDGRTDVRSVKRAYAQKLKTIDRNDANVFQSLRTAFDEAKFLASPSPKKPSMRQAANGVETVPGVVSYTLDFDDLPAASQPKQDPNPQSEGPDLSKAPPEDLDTEDTIVPLPTAPLPTAMSTASNPWSKPEEEPQSDADKEADFFRDLAATYNTGVWKLTPLQNILESDIAMDRGVRDHAEYLLFDRLREAVVEEGRSISQGVAKLMEQNFGWASDGVRFNKKFGWHEGSELVAYDVARAVQSQNVKAPRRRPQKKPLHAKRARIFMCLIMYMGGVFVLYPDGLTAETFLFGTFVAASSFGIIWCFVLFLYHWGSALISAVRRIGMIDRYITRVWQASVERAAWFDRIDTVLHLPGPRSTMLFSVSCAVTLLVLISWGLSRI
ncbi:hypothetical protein [Ascidiaceihabitans sp.]|uniref:hypothetical protein n=1 Tax=Ascidiaceihabitans sp. TaxID=1872644 RepID=UPI003298507E